MILFVIVHVQQVVQTDFFVTLITDLNYTSYRYFSQNDQCVCYPQWTL